MKEHLAGKPLCAGKIHGGKSYLAKRIIELFCPYDHYIENYFGMGAVLLAKNPVGAEIINDCNKRLTNFWRVLQDNKAFESFQRIINCVPFSEFEYHNAVGSFNPSEKHDIECAVRFFIECRQSLAGRMKNFAPITKTRLRRGMNEQVSAWLSSIEGLPEVHERLRRVLILDRDGIELFAQFNNEDCLFYCDPPYYPDSRETPEVYEYEMTHEQHEELLKTITGCYFPIKSKIVLSAYENPLYEEYLKDWRKVVFTVPNSASHKKKKDLKREVCYLNYCMENVFDGKFTVV